MSRSERKKDIATPSRTRDILQRNQLTMKKSLGQNFLVEPNILTKMLAAGAIDKQTSVIEVGPGIGALTERLAQAAKQVIAFEVDGRLQPILEAELADYPNVQIIFKDILQVDLQQVFQKYFQPGERIVVAANLPYYITTPIIMRFIEEKLPIDTFVMMMQKEVAQRMTAQPGTKNYGSLTVAIDYYTKAELAFVVPKTVFMPQPNVDSAILKLQKREQPKVAVKDETFFFKLTQAAFQQRRKTLWNNLLSFTGKSPEMKEKLSLVLQSVKIDPTRRAETLSITEFAQLANAMEASLEKLDNR